MKNIVFISPQFPPNYRHFCAQLRARGARVLGIGDTPTACLDPQLSGVLSDYIHVQNPLDQGQMVRVLDHFQRQYGPIHRIDSLNEYWLPIEAFLREAFDIEGQRPADLQVNRTKLGMKARFQSAGIPCAPGEAVSDLPSLKAFAQKYGYPLILKPDIGVGAGGTYKIEDEVALEAHYAQLEGDYLVEPYIRGEVISYDGLVDGDGNILFETAHLNRAGVMELRQSRAQTWYYSLRDLPAALLEIGRRTLRAFDVKERFFHLEFFWLPEDEFIALEVNIRPPGGFSLDMMNFACDIDLYRWWAQVILGEKVGETYRRKYHSAHISRRNGLEYQHDHASVLHYLGHDCCAAQPVPAIFAEAMGDYMYLVRTPDLAILKNHITFIQAVR